MKMKSLSILALCLCALVANAGTALITLLDGQGNPIPDTRCVLTFFSAPQSQNGGTAIQWRNSAETDTNGQITLTNAAPGNWQVKPLGMNLVGFTFLMPVTNGTIRAEDWITASAGNTLPPDTVSFGVHASDRRYLFTYAGTNGVLVWQTNGITTIDGSAFEAAGTCSNTFTAFTNGNVTFNGGVFFGGGDNGNLYGPIPSYLDDYSWNIQSSGVGDFQGLNVGDVIIRPDHVSGINPGDYCSFPSIYARNGGFPGGAMLTNQFVIGDLSLASNLPAATLTGLATNTPVPISAHITNGVVTWTSP